MKTFTKIYRTFLLTLCLLLTYNAVQAQFTISGTITKEDATPLINVPVILGGADQQTAFTNENGVFEFSVNQVAGSSYTISPQSAGSYLNGVSTFDRTLLAFHLEGTELLDSPYKVWAGDVNNDGNVTTIDLIQIEQLITGVITEFNAPSWKFVDADYVFPNPDNPFENTPTDVYTVNTSNGDVTDADFIGVKTGDLNLSAFGTLDLTECGSGCGTITGSVIYDMNNNCIADIPDSPEQFMQGWLVQATTGALSYLGATDENGTYTIFAPPGDYTVTVLPPNALWTVCENDAPATVADGSLSTVEFRVNSDGDCAMMSVDLGAPFLRRCFESSYFIDYCNHGTITAEDAFVEVTFDSFLTVISTSVPWATQDGNTYTFELGDVAFNECGSIHVVLEVSCDAEFGQTHCSTAQIFPDSICGPLPVLWDGSNVEISGQCTDDGVEFEVINTGDPMTNSVNYIVIEDDMIMMTGDNDPIQLETGGTRDFSLPANGSTWRIEVDQSPNHPLNEILSAAIEGCGENGDGTFSLGFVTQFPQYTPSSAVDVDCEINIGAYDPNDKSAIPEGYAEEHFIKRNTDLEYRIRFQNTGTDTAFNIVIRDTLSPWLDPLTVNPGVSSHDYRFSMEENNILVFTFPNIMLPDSNINEPASHGFVKFNIAQQLDNPLGTVIENTAAIYFDFNDPIITNVAFHTIGENFLDIISNTIPEPDQHFNIKLYPNLIHASATLQVEGLELGQGTFLLYDLQGRLIRTEQFAGNTLEFYKNELSGGLYLFEIREEGRPLSTGKLMIK